MDKYLSMQLTVKKHSVDRYALEAQEALEFRIEPLLPNTCCRLTVKRTDQRSFDFFYDLSTFFNNNE